MRARKKGWKKLLLSSVNWLGIGALGMFAGYIVPIDINEGQSQSEAHLSSNEEESVNCDVTPDLELDLVPLAQEGSSLEVAIEFKHAPEDSEVGTFGTDLWNDRGELVHSVAGVAQSVTKGNGFDQTTRSPKSLDDGFYRMDVRAVVADSKGRAFSTKGEMYIEVVGGDVLVIPAEEWLLKSDHNRATVLPLSEVMEQSTKAASESRALPAVEVHANTEEDE